MPHKPPLDYLVLPAAGKGTRMESETPKQFMDLEGKPVLVRTIEAFVEVFPTLEVILALSEEGMELIRDLERKYRVLQHCHRILGGQTRYDSIKNALSLVSDEEGHTAVHDAARPLVSSRIIQNAFEQARTHDSAIVSVPLKSSLRRIEPEGSMALPRSRFVSVQTPQVFQSALLKEAYGRIAYDQDITDDASVFEKAGHQVHLVDGNYKNIKLTTPEDMAIARVLLHYV